MTVAYIIDHEEHSALLLKDKILDITDYFDDIKIFTQPLLAYQAIIEKQPDLIFSEIEMPFIKGIDLHLKISSLKIPFIYVTSYSEYTLKAIKLQAFDYLLKPVKEIELAETIKRYILSIALKIKEKPKPKLLSFFELTKKQKQRIIVSTSEGVFILLIEEIVKIEALNNYSSITLNDERTIIAPKTLKHFENELKAFGFIRTHKSYLINLNYIERIYSNEGKIQLNNGHMIDVTREKRNEIQEWVKS